MTDKNKIRTYRNLKVHQFLGKRRHLVIEAEPIFSHALGREHIVSLALLSAIQNDLPTRSNHRIIDIEGTAGLHLSKPNPFNQYIVILIT